ncbi:hypothetical protein Cantr_09968 [Candida viswanathii]|uniref:Uncharacterized protein n=1 Tax=Candida viswanathii TaxID=5486 RepID=A0A367YBS1_9ASCO|nr:hypothetical protein Cantr_09968 [Candida viswanathii]
MLIIKLITLPPSVIKQVLSCIPKGCLGYFLDCKALVPSVLPYIQEHVMMRDVGYAENQAPNMKRFMKPFVDAPFCWQIIVLQIQIAVLHNFQAAEEYAKQKKSKSKGRVLPPRQEELAEPTMEDIMAWGVRYLPLFCKIDLLHIVAEFEDVELCASDCYV